MNSTKSSARYSDAAVGLTIFAATLMLLSGAFQAIQGLVALFSDTFYVVGESWVFELDVTTWGWVHLLLGILVALAGLALFQGATWARTVGVVVAGVSSLAAFASMPYYPLWSVLVVALNIFVIWALTAHGRDITAL
ncbi:MAG TPA: hypothetical protein VN257_06505 [Actinotalea sp.]|nr:hypothetical protein [Actinotalea sp.]